MMINPYWSKGPTSGTSHFHDDFYFLAPLFLTFFLYYLIIEVLVLDKVKFSVQNAGVQILGSSILYTVCICATHHIRVKPVHTNMTDNLKNVFEPISGF